MGKIIIKPYNKKATLRKGKTLLAYIQECGININAFCGGIGKCRGCLVRVGNGAKNLNTMTDVEKEFIERPGYRLACQAKILREDENIQVEVPKYARYKVLERGRLAKIPLNPFVKVKREPTGRKVYWKSRVLGDYEDEIYGLALDIGTTTLSMYWVDLKTGAAHLVSSMQNPQTRYGDNIIDRINYAKMEGQKYLEKTIREAVNEMIKEGPINVNHIYEVSVVGNTAMRDIFMGQSVEGLGESPFKSVSEEALNKTAQELKIAINPRANIYALPLIGHFVGADALAVILSTEMHKSSNTTMAIDIGTNTEIAIGNSDKIIATSCASGPAFEGCGLKCGTGAVGGAIEKIEIDENRKVKYRTIDNLSPVGICGSGLIDALAQMLDKGIIDWMGKFTEGEKEFLIARNRDSILLDGEDIDNLKLAKSAISVGTKVLMKHYGVKLTDIEKVYLAGAFGTYIDLESAVKIGILPDIPLKKIDKVGNAAVEGARQVLISQEKRGEAEEISKKISHISLEREKDFQYKFMEELGFDKYRN